METQPTVKETCSLDLPNASKAAVNCNHSGIRNALNSTNADDSGSDSYRNANNNNEMVQSGTDITNSSVIAGLDNTNEWMPTEFTVGLDPMFKTVLQVAVKDIHRFKYMQWNNAKGVFLYKNHVINRVEIIGVVVYVEKREKYSNYGVDDGTGVIMCTCWNNNRPEPVKVLMDLPASLKSKLEELSAHKRDQSYELGELVLISGRINIFRDKRELCVLSHRRITNPNAEMERWSKLMEVYKIYDRPFTPAPRMFQTQRNISSELDFFNELENLILEMINNPSCDIKEIIPSQFMSYPLIASKMADFGDGSAVKLLTKVLSSLEMRTGRVWGSRHPDGSFQVIGPECSLATKVKTIISDVCRHGLGSERGCHMTHIMEVLQTSNEFKLVPWKVVTHAISCLEMVSDVYLVDRDRYMAMDLEPISQGGQRECDHCVLDECKQGIS